MKEYDLILLYTMSRMHNHYLNIVRHLGSRLRIGLYRADIKKKVRTAQTDRLFLQVCASLGADILDSGEHRCRVLAVPLFPYQPGFLPSLVTSVIHSERIIGLQTFGYGTQYLQPFLELGICRLYVYDRKAFERKLKTDEDRAVVHEHFEVVEMGTPVAKYPVFEDFATDYLVAFPTDLSFVTPRQKAVFLRNVNRLLDRLPADAQVTLKLHNVSDGGRLIERASRGFVLGERLYRTLGRAGARLFGDGFLRAVEGLPTPARVRNALVRVYQGYQFARIEARTTSLSAATPYFNFGLELFLPGVRKGLITGRSSVVWYALVNRLPVYNCDDETEAARGEGVTDSYAQFGVPPCHGRLEFDEAAYGRVSESVRGADLLELLQKELGGR